MRDLSWLLRSRRRPTRQDVRLDSWAPNAPFDNDTRTLKRPERVYAHRM
jgi:hypothetical protein